VDALDPARPDLVGRLVVVGRRDPTDDEQALFGQLGRRAAGGRSVPADVSPALRVALDGRARSSEDG